MFNSISFIDYLNEESDYKPQCCRCGYSSHIWVINDEWICKECLIDNERKLIISEIEKALLK